MFRIVLATCFNDFLTNNRFHKEYGLISVSIAAMKIVALSGGGGKLPPNNLERKILNSPSPLILRVLTPLAPSPHKNAGATPLYESTVVVKLHFTEEG